MPRKNEIPGDVKISGSISATSYIGVQALPFKLFVGKIDFTGSGVSLTPGLSTIYIDELFGSNVATSITVGSYHSTINIEFIDNPDLSFTTNFSYTVSQLTYGFDAIFVGGIKIEPKVGNKSLDLVLNGVGDVAYPGSDLNPLYVEIKVFPT